MTGLVTTSINDRFSPTLKLFYAKFVYRVYIVFPTGSRRNFLADEAKKLEHVEHRIIRRYWTQYAETNRRRAWVNHDAVMVYTNDLATYNRLLVEYETQIVTHSAPVSAGHIPVLTANPKIAFRKDLYFKQYVFRIRFKKAYLSVAALKQLGINSTYSFFSGLPAYNWYLEHIEDSYDKSTYKITPTKTFEVYDTLILYTNDRELVMHAQLAGDEHIEDVIEVRLLP